jgi:hypothetical protein
MFKLSIHLEEGFKTTKLWLYIQSTIELKPIHIGIGSQLNYTLI